MRWAPVRAGATQVDSSAEAVASARWEQTAGEGPAVGGRDRYRHVQPLAVEMEEQLGFPRQIDVAARTEPGDGLLPVDLHAPDVVGDTT